MWCLQLAPLSHAKVMPLFSASSTNQGSVVIGSGVEMAGGGDGR